VIESTNRRATHPSIVHPTGDPTEEEQENGDDDFAMLYRLDLGAATSVLADGLRAIDRLQDEIEYEIGLTSAANETMTADLAQAAERQMSEHEKAVAQLAKLEDRCANVSVYVLRTLIALVLALPRTHTPRSIRYVITRTTVSFPL
jgi:hypothetical protein